MDLCQSKRAIKFDFIKNCATVKVAGFSKPMRRQLKTTKVKRSKYEFIKV